MNDSTPPNPKKITDPRANPKENVAWAKIKEPPRDTHKDNARGDKRHS